MRKVIIIGALLLVGCTPSEQELLDQRAIALVKEMPEIGNPETLQVRGVRASDYEGWLCGQVLFEQVGSGWSGWREFAATSTGALLRESYLGSSSYEMVCVP